MLIAGQCLDGPEVQDLSREVPVVERLGGVDSLVALEPDQLEVERLRERLGEGGLAGAGLTLEQDRATETDGEEGHRGQGLVSE